MNNLDEKIKLIEEVIDIFTLRNNISMVNYCSLCLNLVESIQIKLFLENINDNRLIALIIYYRNKINKIEEKIRRLESEQQD